MHSKKTSGFTLLEIMITVAVLAVVGTALVKNATQTVKQTTIIEDRTFGLWIAENQLSQMRVEPRTDENYPGVGTDRFNVTMANREWEVVVQVASTQNNDIRRIEIEVFDEADLDNPVAGLTAFMGRY